METPIITAFDWTSITTEYGRKAQETKVKQGTPKCGERSREGLTPGYAHVCLKPVGHGGNHTRN